LCCLFGQCYKPRMKKLKLPPHWIIDTDHRDVVCLIGTSVQGDGFIDALRKHLKARADRIDERDNIDSNGEPFDTDRHG
jgi:hypothetical protein